MIVIISDDSKGKWGVELADALSRRETEVVHVEADTLNIKPCTACSSCSGKTYGRCVIPDDMQPVSYTHLDVYKRQGVPPADVAKTNTRSMFK